MVDARLFQALSDPTRLKILLLLSRSTMNVTSIVNEVKAAQPAVSRHLRVLREASLINHVRKGKEVEYSLNQPQLRDAKLYIEALGGGSGEGSPEIVEVAVPAPKAISESKGAAMPEGAPTAEEAGATWTIPESSSGTGRVRVGKRKSSGPGIMARRAGKAKRARKASSGRTADAPAAARQSSGEEPGRPEPAAYSERYVVEREAEEAMDDFLL